MKKEQHPFNNNDKWFSESDGGYNSSPVKVKMMREDKRSNKMHRVANKGDFPSDSHLDKAARVRS